ncbi:hypothetical protein AVEN_182530-1 [Araneus ventricosus]|uniref:Uncharacterized protein n=1 Tax=Araneus ventricosus TaxID=182803 RepID=A0A4Y2BXQ7_ARAVE|nr:hypothetical protein AVEN_182530-1 [Araneus ventricosus]
MLKKHLKGRHFRVDAEVQQAVLKWFQDLDADFFYVSFDLVGNCWNASTTMTTRGEKGEIDSIYTIALSCLEEEEVPTYSTGAKKAIL